MTLSPPAARNVLNSLSAFLIDLDGTTYLGERLLPGAREFVERLQATSRRFLFLTNNSSKDAREYSNKLQRLGIQVTEHDIFTSGMATIRFLMRYPKRKRIFLVGTPSLEREFAHAGFILTEETPDYVVLAFDTTITYDKIEKATHLLRAGVEYIATNPDLVCPTDRGFIPDCGSLQALIKAATGREPKIIGKPNREMAQMALELLAAQPQQSAMVGDRLYTDIRMAKEAGMKAILVLTGEAQHADLANTPWQPDLVVPSLFELAQSL